jgi:hypothetical protein
VIRILATLLFATSALAKTHPRPPPPPPPPDVEVPEMPEIPEMPPVPPVPPLPPELDLGDLPRMLDFNLHMKLPKIVARADRDDDDQDNDDNATDEHDENGVHVYRMNQKPRVRVPRVRIERDDDFDRDSATASANGRGSASLKVSGPVSFQLRAQSGDVEFVAGDDGRVTISLTKGSDTDVALYAFGDRIEPVFHGRRTLRSGKLRVELPRGSRIDVSSMSGDVTAQRVGDVRIRTLSGDVKLTGVAKTDVQSISGDVRVEDAAGPVRLHTVSGRALVTTSAAAPQLDFQSASGSLEWSGTCGRDCHLSAETVSGELRLAVDPKSSFDLSYTSHSGELRDELNLSVKRAPGRRHGMASGWMEATYGRGEGVIEADAFSGNLIVKRR